MKQRNYWLDLFTNTTWQEFLQAGSSVTGFRESRWRTVQKIQEGDYLLCYLTGVSRFIGLLEVTKVAYRDSSTIWNDEDFPCRLGVKPIIGLTPETAVSVHDLREKLSFFKELPEHSIAWTGHFRGSPAKWKQADGECVMQALAEAKENPVIRPVSAAKLARRPKAIQARIGLVTIPQAESNPEPESVEQVKESSVHTEIQWLLLKLGNDMNLNVWVARNDKNREFQGSPFSKLPRLKTELPLSFDEATNRTIELIDVLWLNGNHIVAAFEIESTTSIYSGLLRMSDLISMVPNINIPLYIVAPDERRDKVFTEVNRPTFSRLTPPLSQTCRYLSFSLLRQMIQETASVVRYLKPEFLLEFSESCEVEDV